MVALPFALLLATVAMAQPRLQEFPAAMTQMPSAPELPQSILKTLLADHSVYSGNAPAALSCQKQDVADATRTANYRLLCTTVSMGGHAAGFLVMMGVGDFRTETIAPYWLFEKTGQGYVLALKGRAEELDLIPAPNGHGDVDMKHVIDGVITMEHFVFDGKTYFKQTEAHRR